VRTKDEEEERTVSLAKVSSREHSEKACARGRFIVYCYICYMYVFVFVRYTFIRHVKR